MSDDLIAAIKAGDYDNDLGGVFQAVFARAVETETEFAWKITAGGDEWTRETVTLAELAFAERHTSTEYVHLNPIQYADHLVALIVAHFHRVKGMKLDAAIAAAGKLTAADLDEIVSVYEVRQAPKDGPTMSADS